MEVVCSCEASMQSFRLHSFKFQETVILIATAMRTLNFTLFLLIFKVISKYEKVKLSLYVLKVHKVVMC